MRRNQNQRTPDRESVIAAAIGAGKIEAGRADEYRRMYDANPAIIRNLLTANVEDGGLMPGLVQAEEMNADAASAYDQSWLTPGERTALAGRHTAPPTRPAPAPAAPAPTQAAASAPVDGSDEYPAEWLKPTERQRIEAAHTGEPVHGPVQFEDDRSRAAATNAASR